MTEQQRIIGDLEIRMAKINEAIAKLLAQPRWAVFDRETKVAALRAEYERLHDEWLAAKGQTAFDDV